MKKNIISLMLIVVIVLLTLVGCKGSEKQTIKDVSKEDNEKLIKIKMPILASEVGGAEAKEIDQFAIENGFEIERIVIPVPEPGTPDKLLISLMAGDEFDVIYSAYTNMKAFHAAQVIEPLNSLAASNKDDLKSVYGKYLMRFDDEIVGLPAFVDIALTIYNKKLFDEEGIPYPSLEGWTWEKYIETAQKIVDKDKSIWGSYMPGWVHYNFMYAMQKGAEIYTKEGKSNLNDPVFSEALKFNTDLGNELGIQPSYLVLTSKKLPADYFMQGKVGMTVIGAWALSSWIADLEQFPRDWNVGIAPMPYPEGYDPMTSSVIGGYWIPTTCENKENAYQFAKLLAENQYKLGHGRIPARVNISDEEKTSYIENDLVNVFPKEDKLTVEQIKAVLFNENIKPFIEKPVGTAGQVIKTTYANESQLYALGEQTLEETMNNIHEQVQEAIETELANK